ncbi:hypothetical protein AGLY_003807 [Aphis glycines]|uniref:Uncharacterized protein n=1 Tax=Aphis glycines TaxID=307491 RepID=A0A6G0TZ89_APHGL|nr:hypothetical protein AGLY_003807 [Aphis glycines]
MSAAFSPIMKAIAFVCPAGMTGMMEVSTTRRPLIPRTLSFESTTASGSVSGPILQVPDWWCRLVDTNPVAHIQYASDINFSCSQPGNGIGNSLDPYFWNAGVSLTAIACEENYNYPHPSPDYLTSNNNFKTRQYDYVMIILLVITITVSQCKTYPYVQYYICNKIIKLRLQQNLLILSNPAADGNTLITYIVQPLKCQSLINLQIIVNFYVFLYFVRNQNTQHIWNKVIIRMIKTNTKKIYLNFGTHVLLTPTCYFVNINIVQACHYATKKLPSSFIITSIKRINFLDTVNDGYNVLVYNIIGHTPQRNEIYFLILLYELIESNNNNQ